MAWLEDQLAAHRGVGGDGSSFEMQAAVWKRVSDGTALYDLPMPTTIFRLADKRYLIEALVENSTGARLQQFQSGFDYVAKWNNKTELATGLINHLFNAVDGDEQVIELLNFFFVEAPHVDLQTRSFQDLKKKVLDARAIELTEDGYELPQRSRGDRTQATEGTTTARLPVIEGVRGDFFGPIVEAMRLSGDPVRTALGGKNPPSSESMEKVAPFSNEEPFELPPNDVVFVVHGRDMRPVDALDQFLGFLNLRIMSWSDAVKLTGQAQPHTYDIVKAGMDGAAAVIVIFSPDDEARTQRPFRAGGESDDYMGQARQNVLVEAGMAFATSRKRTIFVQSANTRPITDLEGFNWVKMNGDWDSRADLINRLELANAKPQPRYDNLMHHTAGPFKVVA